MRRSSKRVFRVHKALFLLRYILRHTSSFFAARFHLAQIAGNRRFGLPLFMKRLNLETTGACNLQCRMCPIGTGLGNPRGPMTMDVFEKSLHSLADCIHHRIYFSQLHLYSGGEPLTHPGLEEMMAALSRVKAESACFPRTALSTNGTLLTDRKVRNIVLGGAIDELIFSIDMGRKEEFESLRHGADFHEVLSRASNAVETIKRSGEDVRTRLVCLVPKDPGNKGFDPDFLALAEKVDEFQTRFFHNWIGDAPLGPISGGYRRSRNLHGLCTFITDNQVILSDGRITHCCIDISGKGAYADIRNVSLRQSLHAAEKRMLITMMGRNRRRDIDLCRTCEI